MLQQWNTPVFPEHSSQVDSVLQDSRQALADDESGHALVANDDVADGVKDLLTKAMTAATSCFPIQQQCPALAAKRRRHFMSRTLANQGTQQACECGWGMTALGARKAVKSACGEQQICKSMACAWQTDSELVCSGDATINSCKVCICEPNMKGAPIAKLGP